MSLGGKSGLINEAVNQHTNEQLTKAVEYMGTKEYQKSRSTNPDDVIPTHRKPGKGPKHPLPSHLQVHTNEKKDLDGQEGEGAEGDDEEEDEEDDELAALLAKRRGVVKKQTERQQEWASKGHGVLREIGQDDFFKAVVREKGGSELVVMHFYHNDFERCKIMDKHLSNLALQLMPIRFVKCNVEKSPFLVEKLKVSVLPCVVLFVNDIAIDRIVGFDGLEMTDKLDDIDEDSLKNRIEIGLGLAEEE